MPSTATSGEAELGALDLEIQALWRAADPQLFRMAKHGYGFSSIRILASNLSYLSRSCMAMRIAKP